MTDSQNKLVFELSKKYAFETFDFKNKSPEELLKYYQDISAKISKVIEEQNTKSTEESIKFMSELNCQTY